jgi:hypothetical protein
MSFSAAIDRENEGTCAGQREGKWVRIRPTRAGGHSEMVGGKRSLADCSSLTNNRLSIERETFDDSKDVVDILDCSIDGV